MIKKHYRKLTCEGKLVKEEKGVKFFNKWAIKYSDIKINKIHIKKVVYKWWREDKNIWEECLSIFGVKIYKYYSKDSIKYRLFKYKNPKYLKKARVTNIYVGRKEFEEEYNNNKWIIPINYILDLDLP